VISLKYPDLHPPLLCHTAYFTPRTYAFFL
jgi:hypothetical protein